MSRRALVVAFLCALFLAGGARAQDDVERAKRHVERAEAHYSLAEFPEAVDEFKAAYRLAPRPVILFNLGQCYMQMRDFAKAEFSYRAYLRAVPEAANKAMVEELATQAAAALAEENERTTSERAAVELSTAELSTVVAEQRASPLLTAGITTASLGGGLAFGAVVGVLFLEAIFVTDLGSEDTRTGLFWTEKALGAAATMGIAAALVGGTLAATSTLVE